MGKIFLLKLKKHYVIIKFVPVTVTMHAVMAELAYALDSGSSPRKWVGVQVPLTALKKEVAIDVSQ